MLGKKSGMFGKKKRLDSGQNGTNYCNTSLPVILQLGRTRVHKLIPFPTFEDWRLSLGYDRRA